MNSIKDLLPGSMRERTFQLKARRDAGAVWNDPQLGQTYCALFQI